MTLSCGTKLLKYFVFASNAVVCVVGCFFLILSIRALSTAAISSELPPLPDGTEVDYHLERAGLILLAVMSGFTFLVGFLGCFGALTENRGMLLAYSIVMFAFIVLIIAAQFIAIAGRKTFEKSLEDALNEQYNTTEARQNFTQFEEAFHCCGPTPQLKPIFIKEGLCKGELEAKPDCKSMIVEGIGAGYIILTFFLLIATVISLASSCTLRSAFVDRGSYTGF